VVKYLKPLPPCLRLACRSLPTCCREAEEDVGGNRAPDSGHSSSSRQEAAFHRQAGGGTAAPAGTHAIYVAQ